MPGLQSVAEAEPGAPELCRSDEDDVRLREGVQPDPDCWTRDRLDLATRSWGPGWRYSLRNPEDLIVHLEGESAVVIPANRNAWTALDHGED